MRIKYSKRGLTFSFKGNDYFQPGIHYRYFIDVKSGDIILTADEDGKYKLSQKGVDKKPLVDLRNAEIRNAISLADYIEISIENDVIIVKIINKTVECENLSDRELISLLDKEPSETFSISKEQLLSSDDSLLQMLKASGFLSEKIQLDISYVYDVASLFSGAGLLDYPFKCDDSFDIRFGIDFDKSACLTYKENIGDHILCMDMRELDESQVPDVDVIIGGPCCQGYSNANRAGNIEQDKAKRLLIDDYIRIVKAKKPLVFLVENVPEFITKEQGMYLEKVLTELSDYEISYSVVNDHEVGGFSKRKRMLLVGSKIGKIIIPNVELGYTRTVNRALSKVDSSWFNFQDITKPSDETARKMSLVRPGHNYKDIPEMAHLDRHSNVYRRLNGNEPSVTITNWRKVNLMPPVGNRILSVAEAASIMGLDKNFKFLGSLNDRQQQCGNGVTQHIARFAKTVIKNALYAYTNQKLSLV